jgi:hypothetical protein
VFAGAKHNPPLRMTSMRIQPHRTMFSYTKATVSSD